MTMMLIKRVRHRLAWFWVLSFVGLGVPLQAATLEIVDATYSVPTTAYPHGVLGDDEEWQMLEIVVRRERGTEGGIFHGYVNVTYNVEALPDTVYEDIAPRLWDVTGDGKPEVVVVESHQTKGARLLIIELQENGELEYLTATPYIGQRFRWLAPVGAADFDGDGFIEIAFVDRPHLAKVLKVWRYTPELFSQIATLQDVSNHRIGEDFITGGVRDCGEGPEMVIVDGSWRKIFAARLSLTAFTAQPIAAFSGPASMEKALACE